MLEKHYISKKDNTDLNVYRCGFEECSPNHTWGPGVRDHYIVHVILSGRGLFTADGQTHDLESGQGFLICPGQIVRYEADAMDPWTYSWAGFHGLKADSVLRKAGLDPQNPIFSINEDTNGELLKKNLNDMIISARNEESSELMLTGFLYLFLSRLVQNHQRQASEVPGLISSDRYVARAVEYIERNYAGKLSVGDISRKLKINRSYLSALFSRYLGMPPRDFMIGYRMDKACELLKKPQLSVGDVARSVGYEDPLQFSKIFRKSTGVSPKQYRARSRQNHDGNV